MTRSIRPLLLAATLGLAAALPGATVALAETIKVSLVQTNDIDRMEEEDGRGGFARLAAVVAAERAGGTVVFVHAGDTISPSLCGVRFTPALPEPLCRCESLPPENPGRGSAR
jgi:5'-nucleotidase / UDP-sugar diphosphatase